MKKTINSLIAAVCLLPALGMAATTVTLSPVADAYVQGGNKADVNYGTATELRIQANNTPAKNYKSYLKFDTSAIAEQVRSSAVPGSFSARLRVYAALSGSGSISTRVYGVSDTSWSESAITWNTKPAFGSMLGGVTVASTAYAWQEIDVSTYVENEIDAGRNVISLALDDNEITSSVYVNANSREAANPPQLVIAFNAPPTVTITSPAEGSVYTAPASVTLTADAVDSDGSIADVTFVVWDGSGEVSRQTLTAPPFTYTLNGLPAGSYTIDAKATDNDGGEAITPPPTPVSFTVNPAANVPPSVSLTSPTEGSSYTAPASITLTADATDSDGSIASVEFYDGATLIASLTAPPYSHTWNDVPAGSHVVTAKATDNQGTATTSTPASISVNAAMTSGVYYIYADHLNTPRVITDASNTVVWRWDSDPFGAEKANEDPDGDGAKFTYNLRFPGQYYDRETNLHYNYFRDYDPTTGRYVQSDPIGLEGGMNTYTYVGGNPVSWVDPRGLDREVIFWSPLPYPGSIFGHVSSRGGNGENYSFGPDGWDKTYPTAEQYIDRQTTNNRRTGLGVVVELNKGQDAKYDRCMSSAKTTMSGDDYDGVTNCSSPSQACLITVGVPISPSILPVSYQQELLNSGSVKSINWYRRK